MLWTHFILSSSDGEELPSLSRNPDIKAVDSIESSSKKIEQKIFEVHSFCSFYSTVTPSVLGTKVPFVEAETKRFRLIQLLWMWAMGVKSQLLDSHMFLFSWCHSKLSFFLPWSFLKMRPNPMLQTYQCFFPKSGADLPSFFHRECVFSVKVGFYKATPDFAVPESGWSPLTKEISGHQHN